MRIIRPTAIHRQCNARLAQSCDMRPTWRKFNLWLLNVCPTISVLAARFHSADLGGEMGGSDMQVLPVAQAGPYMAGRPCHNLPCP